MSIKSVVNGVCQPKCKPFPKLMRGKGSQAIYLMNTYSSGMIVNNDDANKYPSLTVGRYFPKLEPVSLEDFNGTITLSNE